MENPSFRLEGIVREKDSMQDFEGPLSLILMLLQKNKIEIRDLSVSDILDQYLEYLDRMQSLDLEIASEFVQMAAHLLYLKTRTLLTTEEEVSELELLMQSPDYGCFSVPVRCPAEASFRQQCRQDSVGAAGTDRLYQPRILHL